MADVKSVIRGLEWILKDDRFGFGINWTVDSKPRDNHEKAGYNITRAIELIKEQQELVRCKDCRYAVPLTGSQKQQVCQHDIPYPLTGPIVDNDWFCADGKHK